MNSARTADVETARQGMFAHGVHWGGHDYQYPLLKNCGACRDLAVFEDAVRQSEREKVLRDQCGCASTAEGYQQRIFGAMGHRGECPDYTSITEATTR